MDTNKMREQFEAWVLRDYPNQNMRRFNNGEYCSTTVEHCWLSWQASREVVVVELGAPSHWVADYAACGGGQTVFDAEKASKVTDPMCSKTPAYTIHALEKAGLKVAP
ncbi:hypothetical protein [Pseudomonas sp. Irchel 3F3]|uniref:hypothetical protein n=1 Tax=Pseudomonas sp. Irchel 3F3 TaxID=2009000 RepID=UPI000BA3EB2F|nr:hypothetical protein [Pseudomonas sp. Irchel 3F3]